MQTTYNGLELPQDGQPIEYANGQFEVPDNPIIPFIEGDGTGRDIWKASQRVFDAAVEKAYGGKRAIRWFEILAGEKAFRQFNTWLPDDSVAAARDLRVSIKGPLTTPIGGGIRSLNVALRQILDLYACVRPVKYYQGVPSPVKHPEKVDIVIFRENTEDVYAGIEFKQGSADAARLIDFLNNDLLKGSKKNVRADSGVGIKPISIFGTKRLVRYAIRFALETGRKTVTLVHKGNIQKFTEGAFREWGYEVATQEFRAQTVTERESWILGNVDANPDSPSNRMPRSSSPAWNSARPAFRDSVYAEVKAVLDSIGQTHGNGAWKSKMLINDRIADSIFQQIIHPPGGLQRPGHHQPQRRLHLRRRGGAGRRPGHRARRQHRRRLRRLRGHARHRAQVRRQGRDQSRLGDSFRRDAAGFHRLEGSGQADRAVAGKDDPAEVRHLRLRAPDRRRHQGGHQRICHAHHRQHVKAGNREIST